MAVITNYVPRTDLVVEAPMEAFVLRMRVSPGIEWVSACHFWA
ncbi:hypothetical protein AB0L57_30115 [Nocardia sp. NPDC052254]